MTTLIATGSLHIRGSFVTEENAVYNITASWQLLPNFPFSGKALSDITIGGCTSPDGLVNYKNGYDQWSNVVKIPSGSNFSLEVLSYGDIHSFAEIKVKINN